MRESRVSSMSSHLRRGLYERTRQTEDVREHHGGEGFCETQRRKEAFLERELGERTDG